MTVKTNTKYNNSKKQFLAFETVTVVPIQTKHMLTSLLTDAEVSVFYCIIFETWNILNKNILFFR